MNVSTPTGRCGPCCSIAATGSTAITLAMSAFWKSFQLISAHIFVGSRGESILFYVPIVGSGRPRGDRLDLDLELTPRKARNDHQRRGGRRVAYELIAHLHIAG